MSNVFALIIGISKYQSRDIANLASCVSDAHRMRRYLTDTLEVPASNIEMLLNAAATQRGIEDAVVRHLICNPLIQRGDAIIIYWAGHGSRIPAPSDWLDDGGWETRRHNVEVLCTYDYEKMRADGMGRVAGISDRSMKVMLSDLAAVKGDNITFIVDCCFVMPPSAHPERDRLTTRCTPALKTCPGDLYRGLWPAARGQRSRGGFRTITCGTTILACSKGERAVETRKGGSFTLALMEALKSLSLHRTTNAMLCDQVQLKMKSCTQSVYCTGEKNRLVLDGTPFEPDPTIFALHAPDVDSITMVVDAGTKAGLKSGVEMTIHLHQYGKSRNEVIGKMMLEEVNADHSKGRVTSGWGVNLPQGCCWARVVQSRRRWSFSPLCLRVG